MFDPLADAYSAALDFLYRRINYETAASFPYRDRELNLPRMRWLLEQLGNPQDRLPIVHIAGTKGKGSTAGFISSILSAAGYRVGTYTSPHLVDLEERFAVDGKPCTPRELIELVAELRARLPGGGSTENDELTFFDITTALGLLHFVRREVEIAVLEVGMGGRLDSTNVCQPLVSVITSIGLDHTRQLGNTLAAIAAEKAGIIKPGVPVVSGVVDAEPVGVIQRFAADQGCALFQRERDFVVRYEPGVPGCPGAVYYAEESSLPGWRLGPARLGMLGRHQAANAGVALATVSLLKARGWQIGQEQCLHGLATSRCPARIEVLSREPAVIVDTAHNTDSIRALVSTVNENFPRGSRILIFAVSRDKDAAGLLRLLLPEFDQVILTRFTRNPRGLPVSELAETARGIVAERGLSDVQLQIADTPLEAWNRGLAICTPRDLLCIAGSFFLAAEFGQTLHSWHGSGTLPS